MAKKYSATQRSGYEAEKIACSYLEKQGFRLITRNFRLSFGEIDLIMENETTLIFVEVRKRKPSLVTSEESIDRNKQKKITRTALCYLQKNPTHKLSRLDVVTIKSSEHHYEINWIKDAFQVQ